MSNKVSILFFSFLVLTLLLVVEVVYLKLFHSLDEKSLQAKHSFSTYIGLPDLAISNEPSLRHRSMSSVFDVYSLDVALREYEKETFVISKSKEL